MQLHTYRARSLAEALRVVRDALGPDASVVNTRDVGSQFARLLGGRMIEVTASAEIDVPSRLPEALHQRELKAEGQSIQRADLQDYRRKIRQNLRTVDGTEASLVERLAAQRPPGDSPPNSVA